MPRQTRHLCSRILLLVLAFLVASGAARGQIWSRATLPDTGWIQLASSSDCTKIAATGLYGGNAFAPEGAPPGCIVLSTNSGLTWTLANVPESYWLAIASSTNGNTVIAASEPALEGGPGLLYWSTNSGATWIDIPNSTIDQFGDWGLQFGPLDAVACSADGRILVVGHGDSGGGGIMISTNGEAWTTTSFPNLQPTSIVASPDASKLLVTAYGFDTPSPTYWISTNTGGTWAPATTPGGFTEIASSAEVNVSVAAIYDTNQVGGIYFSTNSWATWISTGQTSASGGWWLALATLAPTGKLLAVSVGGGIYLTMGTGTAWPLVHSLNENWNSMVCSRDGSKLVGVVFPVYPQPPASGLGIFVWPSTPALSISSLARTNQLLLSWPVTTPSLALGASADLIGTNWASITNIITTTNGILQAVVPITTSNTFFRLRVQ